ncbi:hypothetical protein K456DRAFT_43311 [Colletotrichum gloeosporioides 23]|nr:hypothetical protein K456DRAFT_43311 [Colletotrichum gloeosporioides 23]
MPSHYHVETKPSLNEPPTVLCHIVSIIQIATSTPLRLLTPPAPCIIPAGTMPVSCTKPSLVSSAPPPPTPAQTSASGTASYTTSSPKTSSRPLPSSPPTATACGLAARKNNLEAVCKLSREIWDSGTKRWLCRCWPPRSLGRGTPPSKPSNYGTPPPFPSNYLRQPGWRPRPPPSGDLRWRPFWPAALPPTSPRRFSSGPIPQAPH